MKTKTTAGMALAAMVLLAGAPAGNGSAVPFRIQEGGSVDEMFTLENGLFSLGVIRECLQSFQKLTAEAKGKIAAAKMNEIGNTGWEMQTLGFHNQPGILEGTLIKQEMEIKRLAWEVAGLKLKAGATGETEFLETRKAYDAAKTAYAEFKARFRIKD